MIKNLPIIMFIIILNIVSTNLFAQRTYYWYFDKKIDVSINQLDWTLKNIDAKASMQQRLTLKGNQKIEKILHLSNGFYKVSFSASIASADLPDNLREFAIPSLIIKDRMSPLFMNGNIILMPKENQNIESIEKAYGLKLINKLNYGAYLMKVLIPTKTLEIANKIHESGLVNWCTPDFYAEMRPNLVDPLYNNQYYLNQNNDIDINAPEAWSFTKGSSSIKVAVLDQGVDGHEDLSGNLITGFTPGSNNTNGSPINSGEEHGVACAGIIAANHDNGVGIKGIAPYSKIIPIKILGDGSYNYTISEVATAITWSYQSTGGNADILSNSWGFTAQGFYDASIAQVISNARTLGRGGKGAVVVFASGNSNAFWSGVTFPANLAGVVTVGAIDSFGAIWGYSSRGPEMDLVCPSGDVNYLGDVVTLDRMGTLGLNLGNYMGVFGGTSAACPQVSGVAALMLSANPNLTEAQVRNILQTTAVDMGAAGFDNTFGFGRLNACAAVFQSLGTVLSISGPSSLCNQATYSIPNLPTGATVTWSVTGTYSISGSNTANPVTLQRTSNGYGVLTANITTSCGNYTVTKNLNPVTISLEAGDSGSCGGTATVAGVTGSLTWTVTGDLLIDGTSTTLTTTNNQISFTGTEGSIEVVGGDCSINLSEYFAPFQAPISFAVNPAIGSEPLSASVYPYNHSYSAIRWYLDGTLYETGTEIFYVSNPPCGNSEVKVEIDLGCGITITSTATFERLCSWWRSMAIYPNPASSYLNIQPDAEKLKTLSAGEKSAMKEYEASLYDINGKLLLKGRSSGYQLNLDTRHLKSDNYFIHIKIDGEKEIIKKQVIIRN